VEDLNKSIHRLLNSAAMEAGVITEDALQLWMMLSKMKAKSLLPSLEQAREIL
jgi:hypothetical protein